MNRLFIENQPYSIFRQDETAKFYEGRCLPLATFGDMIVTSNPINEDYLKYLESIGLEITGNIDLIVSSIKSKDLATSIIKDNDLLDYIRKKTIKGNWKIEAYLYDETLKEILDILDLPLSQSIEIFENYGTKTGFRELALELKLPIPEGIAVSGSEMDKVLSFSNKYKDVVIKKDNTIGGIGVFNRSGDTSIQEIITNKKTKYVIEERIIPKIQGSIQIFINNGTYDLIIDECITEGNHFKGFVYPYIYNYKKIEYYGEIFAKFLLKERVEYGNFGLDFMISNDKIFFHDFNPRRTGVSYVMLFLYKMFGTQNVKKSAIINEHLVLPLCTRWDVKKVIQKLNPLLYKYGIDNEGLLLFNCDLLKFNLLNLISISFNGKEKEYMQIAKRNLGISELKPDDEI